jgi:hypothetical protein
MVISMNVAIDKNPYDTSPFRSALRPCEYAAHFFVQPSVEGGARS